MNGIIFDIKETIKTNNAKTTNTIAIATNENNKSPNVTAKNIFFTYPIIKLTSITSSVSFLSLLFLC